MKKFFIVVGFLVLSTILLAQEIEIVGKVSDADGVTIPGVTVIVKGTTEGTITDINGRYSVSADKNATLVFSFIGYTTVEHDINGEVNIDIVMEEEVKEINEVVVTALGIGQAKKSIGYATQEVKSEELTRVNTSNVGSLLTGQVAGLTVNNRTGLFQEPTFLLRGKSPLIVVDEIPVETDFYDLSPNDIENIVVLKGPTASSLYGSRGRNGALLITTKGAKKDGVVVTVSNNTMVTAGFTVFPERQTEYGNGSNGKYEFWDGKDGGISDGDMIWGPKFSDNLEIAQWNSPILDNVTGEITPWWGNVSGTKFDDKSRYSRVPIPWKYHNNLKEFMQLGYISTTNFSVASKTEKSNSRLSGFYQNHKGRVPNTSLKTGGLSFKSSYKLTNSLTLDSKLAYNKVYSPNYPRHGYGPRNHIYTLLVWMGDDVNGKELNEHHYIPGQEGYRQANFNYAWYNNVYFAAYELNQRHDENVTNGQLKLKWEIAENISFQIRSSAVIESIFRDRQSPKSYLNYGDPREGDYKTWNEKQVNFDNDILFSYKKELSKKLGFRINAGASSFYRKFQEEYNATDGIVVPFVYSLNNTKGNVKASTYYQEREVRSVYGAANFDFANILFLTLTARNDWSSTLPESNNSYFYPSVSLSSLVSNIVNLPTVFEYLKVYGSWAVVSSDLSPYQISSYYSNAGSYGGKSKLSYPGGIVNPDIKPETSTSFEIGLASSFLKNRLNFDFTYFNIVDENQIINLPISVASGFSDRKVNGNQYTTNGIELMLKGTPVSNSNFKWNIGFNLSSSVKRITAIYGDEKKYGNYSLGERVDNLYGRGWMKNAQGRVILSSSAMPIRDPFPQMFGHLNPNFRFGLQNSFNYKGFDVSIGFDGAFGGVMPSKTVSKMWWGGAHPNSIEFRDEEYAAGGPVYVPYGVVITGGELVTDSDGNVVSDTRTYQENTKAVSWQTWCQNYPYRAYINEQESKEFANVLDRTFIKLRKVSVSYDLKDVFSLNSVKGLELSMYGYNLWIWKKAMIIDPDFGDDNNLQDPSSRYLGMGIKLIF